VAPDLEEARSWFARAVESGLADAQVALGEMMLNGRGGSRSPTDALEMFDKAAAKGHSGHVRSSPSYSAGLECELTGVAQSVELA
jgi:TPR repeat protein